MTVLYHKNLTERSGAVNQRTMDNFFDIIDTKSARDDFVLSAGSAFTELLFNTLNHSRTGVGLRANEIALTQYPVQIYYCDGHGRQTLMLQNYTDELRAEELLRRVRILEKGDRHLGAARHIYQDDPDGHDGRGNGLRDIFMESDIVQYRVIKPRSGSTLRHVTAVARFTN